LDWNIWTGTYRSWPAKSIKLTTLELQILGFSPKGDAVVPTGHAASVDIQHLTTAKREKMSWDEICSKSSKVVSFIDLAGHERYVPPVGTTASPFGENPRIWRVVNKRKGEMQTCLPPYQH
jgi:hypothetical protein